MALCRWMLLALLPLLSATLLHAQSSEKLAEEADGKAALPRPAGLDIRFVVPDDEETFWEMWREGDDGPFVLALPFAVEVTYEETSEPDAFGQRVTKKLRLLADRALIWFEPDTASGNVEDDPFLAMARGAKNLQFYGEGNVWMRYSVGKDYVTLRADRTFLDFARSKVIRFDADGNETFTEQLNLKGRLDNVRAHSGADRQPVDSAGGVPLETGVGVGNAADEARDRDRSEAVGAAPSEDAVPEAAGRLKSLPQEQGLRLFMRAKQLRIISLTEQEQEIELERGSISSSSLSVASYSLAAELLTVRLTPVRNTVFLTRPAVRVLDYPLIELDVEDYSYDLDSQPPIRQLDIITSNQYGFGFRTYIDAVATYDFFADPEPPFYPLQLGPQIDYFSLRGLGLGVNLDWGRMRNWEPYGRATFRSYYINDSGDKRDRARDLGWYPVEKHSRGRIEGAYSQGFDGGWYIDHFLSYESDRNFRREFYKQQYDNNAPIDSFWMLTKRSGHLNYFVRFEPKLHWWQNKTEYLPALGFETRHLPVGDFGLYLSSHTEAAVLRFAPADRDPRESISTIRADSLTWLGLPLELGPFALDPYVGTRVTLATNFLEIPEGNARPGLAADGTFPGLASNEHEKQGYLYRFLPFFGVNLQTFITGTFPDFKIPLLGIDGLRHVFAPFVRYHNTIYNSLDDVPERAFIPLDMVDVLDEFHEIRVGFRNRLQTRQGRGEDRRTVDYHELMVELPIYPNRQRDNGGELFGDLEVQSVWRAAPGYTISGGLFLDMRSFNINRAWGSFRFDLLHFGQGNIYYRLLRGQHEVVGIQLDLALSELYRVGIKQEYDLEKREFRDTRLQISRRVLEAVDLGFTFVRDPVDGEVGFYFSVAAAFRAPRGGSSLLR